MQGYITKNINLPRYSRSKVFTSPFALLHLGFKVKGEKEAL
jgi:hypothetical protein